MEYYAPFLVFSLVVYTVCLVMALLSDTYMAARIAKDILGKDITGVLDAPREIIAMAYVISTFVAIYKLPKFMLKGQWYKFIVLFSKKARRMHVHVICSSILSAYYAKK